MGGGRPTPGPTVDDLAAAYADVPVLNPTAATDVTVDGFHGKQIEFTVPDYNEDECRDGRFGLFQEPGFAGRGPNYWAQAPQQYLRLWILDINGTRLGDRREHPGRTPPSRTETTSTRSSTPSKSTPSSRPNRPATTIRSTRPQRPPPHLRKTIEHPPGRRGRRDGPTSHDESATDSPFGRRRVVGDALALDGVTSAELPSRVRDHPASGRLQVRPYSAIRARTGRPPRACHRAPNARTE